MSRPHSFIKKCLSLFVFFFGALAITVPNAAQQPSSGDLGSAAVIPVLVTDKHTNAPAQGLKAADFEVVSGHNPMRVSSLATGTDAALRPLTFWFVLQCPEDGIAFSWVSYGSGFMRGKSGEFTPVLQKLHSHDTVGVAHWCDNGTLGIDLSPTADRAVPATVIEKVTSAPMAHVSDQPGQNALHDVFLRVREATQLTSPGSQPIVIFLYGDRSGMYHEQVAELLNQPKGPMPIVYGINNGAVSIQTHPMTDKETQLYVVHFLSDKTGGKVLSTFHGKYSEELEKIVLELQGRYELRVIPPVLDSKPGEIKVKLTEEARKNLKSDDVRFASVFVPSAQALGSAGQDLQATMLAAVRSGTPYTDVAFDASCKKSAGPDQVAQCRLFVDPRKLTWSSQENGERQSELALISATVSAQGSVLASEMKRFAVVQGNADQGANPKAIILSVSLPVPPEVARLLFVLRDSASTHLGSFSVAVDQTIPAPKTP